MQRATFTRNAGPLEFKSKQNEEFSEESRSFQGINRIKISTNFSREILESQTIQIRKRLTAVMAIWMWTIWSFSTLLPRKPRLL